MSDHLGNEGEALEFQESLWVGKDEHQARMLLEELSRPFILASWSPGTLDLEQSSLGAALVHPPPGRATSLPSHQAAYSAFLG